MVIYIAMQVYVLNNCPVQSSLRARFDPELTLLIQLTLYKLSIWDIGASYGAKLQEIYDMWYLHLNTALEPVCFRALTSYLV